MNMSGINYKWFIIIIVILAVVFSEIEKAIKRKKNTESDFSRSDEDESPIVDDSKKRILDDIKMKEENDYNESLQEAYDVLKHKPDMIPGLSKQNPISAPKEEVILDEKEIPWELKDDENGKK